MIFFIHVYVETYVRLISNNLKKNVLFKTTAKQFN